MSEEKNILNSSTIHQLVKQISTLSTNPESLGSQQATLALLNHIIPKLKKHLDTESTLSAVKELVNDPITRRTPVIAEIKRLLDNEELHTPFKIRQIVDLIDLALINQKVINLLFFKFNPTHPDSIELYKKIYTACTEKSWEPKPAAPQQSTHEEQSSAFHQKSPSNSGSSAAP